jgi:hypothetical protein
LNSLYYPFQRTFSLRRDLQAIGFGMRGRLPVLRPGSKSADRRA